MFRLEWYNRTYEQVPPVKSIQSTSFPGGRIEHRFEVSGKKVAPVIVQSYGKTVQIVRETLARS